MRPDQQELSDLSSQDTVDVFMRTAAAMGLNPLLSEDRGLYILSVQGAASLRWESGSLDKIAEFAVAYMESAGWMMPVPMATA